MKISENDKHLYEDQQYWQEAREINHFVKEKIKIIEEIIPENVTSIADIGCGNGVITNSFIKKWWVIGTDRSRQAIRFAKSDRVQADINALPFQDNVFDFVICSEVLEHLPSRILADAIQELQRISKKYLLITVPNDEALNKNQVKCPNCKYIFNAAYHLHSFNKEKLVSLFPQFHQLQYFECGKAVRQYRPTLLRIKQQIGNSWAQLKVNRILICPECSHRFRYHKNTNLISLICDGLNKLLSPRRPYWLGILFAKAN